MILKSGLERRMKMIHYYKVKSVDTGIIHILAQCHDCDFEKSDYLNVPKLREQVRRHVAKTGHTVTIETGKATIYSADEVA